MYEKVAYSKFASPNVAVLKDVNEPAGPIRLCGDYKVSIQIFILKLQEVVLTIELSKCYFMQP